MAMTKMGTTAMMENNEGAKNGDDNEGSKDGNKSWQQRLIHKTNNDEGKASEDCNNNKS